MREQNSKKLKLKWVTDVIGDDYKNWREGDTVILQAQTGTGKTYFVKNKLVPMVESYESMLILCNRVYLKRQLKLDLIEMTNDLEAKKLIYKEDKNKNIIVDNEALDKLTVIDERIVIISYHAIANASIDAKYRINDDFNIRNFKYIVMDECHFLKTDAPFAQVCNFAFNKLLREMCPESIKIFISATLEELKEDIVKLAEDNNKQLNYWGIEKCGIKEYSTGINEENETGMDYSYLNTKYFKNLEDIVNLIRNDKSDEKWIIFVQKKKDMEKLAEDLNGIDGGVGCVKAGDKNNTNLDSIINQSKFNSRILITTKVLDNGVNIEDDKVKNVVIMALDRVTFVQELGRIRVDIENAPEINLFIRKKTKKTFKNLLDKTYKNKQEQINLFKESQNKFDRKYDFDYDKLPKDIFYKDGEWKINEIGLSKFNSDVKFAERMYALTNGDDMAFIKEQLSWIGLEDTFDGGNMIEDVILEESKGKLAEFLTEAYETEGMFTKEYFIKTMTDIINNDDRLRVKFNKKDGGNKRSKGQSKFNELFKEEGLKYIVSSRVVKKTIDGKRKNITYWIVTKIEN